MSYFKINRFYYCYLNEILNIIVNYFVFIVLFMYL